MMTVSTEVFNRLKRLADSQRRFFMLAIDQRGSVKKMLAKALRCEAGQVPHEAIARVKKIITEILAPEATAVLIDSEYGFEGAWQAVPANVGKLSTLEKSGGEKVIINGIEEERTVLLSNWSVSQAARKGADAVKLLVPYHPQSSEETRKYQESLVKQIGVECDKYDLPFLVEYTSYPVSSPSSSLSNRGSTPGQVGDDMDNLANERLHIVAKTVQVFDQPDFNIALHKVEFPGDIKQHTPKQLVQSCQRVGEAVTKPWVLLSAGVNFDIFEKEVAIACENGASGFLAGRAIWQEAVALYDHNDKEQKKIKEWLEEVGVGRMKKLKEVAKNAQPYISRLKS